MNGLTIIFVILLIDAVTAVAFSWLGRGWYIEHFRLISRYFPLTKGWTTYYLVLVLYIGFLTLR